MESHCSPNGTHPQRSLRLERHDQIALRFHHLSMSNLPPTDVELSEIQTTILPGLEQDIFAVDSAVAVARALESLEQERDALKNIKRNFENIISTRRRIPPEILSEIFLYAHHMDSVKRDDSAFDWPSRTIWQISQVCQAWRHLAWSLHSCWSSIVLDFSSGWSTPEKDLALLSFVLERSGQHSLNISLINHSLEDLPLPLCRIMMRGKVFDESHRWRTARLLDCHREMLYAPLCGRLPLLEHLEFESNLQGTDSDSSVIWAFKECPRLVTIGLTGADPRTIELPVEQITRLHLCDKARPGYLRAYVDLVSRCLSLEVLRVDLLHEAGHDSVQKSLTLPSLRNFSATYPDLLDSLTLPHLEVAALDQKYNFPHDPNTLYAFQCLIRRSNCAHNLTELRIINVSLSLHRSEPHLLLSILSQTAALATLKVEASIFDFRLYSINDWTRTQITDVMKALEVVAGQHVTFLPRLLSLEIDVTGHTDMDYLPYLEPHEDFIGMLTARRTGNEGELSKLERFHFRVWEDMAPYSENESLTHETIFNEQETAVLRGLADDGMSLDISFDGVLAAGL